MAKEEKTGQQKINFRLEFNSSMRRVYFNRFTFLHENGVRIVRVWYQDEMMRVSNAYAFIFADEDVESCKSDIRNYIQKIMVPKASKVPTYCADVCAAEFKTVDTVRVMTCSRVGTRSEIYLGFFPINHILSTGQSEEPKKINMDVVLCACLDCHVELLRKVVS